MNPFEVERLGWDSIRGLPIRPNPDLGTGSFRMVCAREDGLPAEEESVEAVADQTVPVELTPAALNSWTTVLVLFAPGLLFFRVLPIHQ